MSTRNYGFLPTNLRRQAEENPPVHPVSLFYEDDSGNRHLVETIDDERWHWPLGQAFLHARYQVTRFAMYGVDVNRIIVDAGGTEWGRVELHPLRKAEIAKAEQE